MKDKDKKYTPKPTHIAGFIFVVVLIIALIIISIGGLIDDFGTIVPFIW